MTQLEPKPRKASKLVVTVSDSLAAVTTLPWQDGLRKSAELQHYARIFFEQNGMDIDRTWVIHVEYRRFGAAGLAYALPRAWMDECLAIAEGNGLRLERVMPVSAASYCGVSFSGAPRDSLVFLQEQNHIAMVHYQDGCLIQRDVEPVARSADESCFRLLARLKSRWQPDPAMPPQVAYWSYKPLDVPKAVIEANLPGTQIQQFGHNEWN